MLRISKMTDYAVVVLTTLAHSDHALMTTNGVSAKTGLPEPTVAKILKLLSRGNFLASIRGVNGGYKLLKTPAEISVAQIIAAIDGPIALTSCVDDNDQSCGYQNHCAMKGRWNNVNFAVRSALENVTLASMMNYGCAASQEEKIIEVNL